VGVHRLRELAHREPGLDRERRLGDEVRGVGPHDLRADDPSVAVGRDLELPLGLPLRPRPAERGQGEPPPGQALGGGLIEGDPHQGHLGLGEDRLGDHCLPPRHLIPGEELGEGEALMRRLVGEEPSAAHVADRVHARGSCERAVRGHVPSLDPRPHVLHAKLVKLGLPAHRHEDGIRRDLLLACPGAEDDPLSREPFRARPEPDLDPLSGQGATEEGLAAAGQPHPGEEAVEELHHPHLAPQPPVHGPELKPDHPAPDHDEAFRHARELQRVPR